MHYLYQVNIYLYYQKGKICVQCLVYSPCCLLLFLWIMDNMPVGIISAVYLSIFQHSGIFIFLCRSFGICTCLVNICLIFFFLFFSSFLYFSPLIIEVIFLKEINKWKKNSAQFFQYSVVSVWTSYASPVELHKTELLNYSQLHLYKYRQW